MAKSHINIRQQVTDTIIEHIEAGTPPWRQPWTGAVSAPLMPLRCNGVAYRGINVLMLRASAHARNYASAHWMTYWQALELGG